MRRWTTISNVSTCLALVAIAAVARAQPSGSSPEAALEAHSGQHSPNPQYVELEEARARMVGPACSFAAMDVSSDAHQLKECVRTMEESLGWDDVSTFSTCSAEGIETSRVEACASAIHTFLLHHEEDEDVEHQAAASLVLMKDLCSGSTLCGMTPET